MSPGDGSRPRPGSDRLKRLFGRGLSNVGLAPAARLRRALSERDEARTAAVRHRAAAAENERAADLWETELATVRVELDQSRTLQATQARLWAASLGDGNLTDPDGFELAFNSVRAHGEFSYWRFEQVREQLIDPSNPYLLSDKVRTRIGQTAGPVRFGSDVTGSPPPDGVAFACVCTDKFVPGLELLIASLLDLYPGMTAPFWVFHDDGLTGLSRQRLELLYPDVRFESRPVDPYVAVAAGHSPNQVRIGATGYLNIEALRLDQYRRVILLDSDLIATGDIGELWAEPDRDDVRVVPDAGVLPFATRSEHTGAVIFNSGVISLPQRLLGEDRYERVLACLDPMMAVDCPGLRDFADQRFWNVFLGSDDDVTYVSQSLNANKQLVERHMPQRLGEVSILHYTGAKPWFDFASPSLLAADDRRRAASARSKFPLTFGLWDAAYRRLVGDARRRAFVERMGGTLDELRDLDPGGRAVLIGNGPSLARTDLDVVRERHTIAFNWFVNHPEFDHVEVDHLMVMSHMFFGGWQTPSPAFPEGFVDTLLGHRHQPRLWFPFYFEPLVSSTPELDGYDVSYLLLEKPFKRFAEDVGAISTDLTDFLLDAHTGVLTAGFPLARWLGCGEIVLVGCDANYGRTGNDYFYAPERHTSLSTRTTTLHNAWETDGSARYCYELALRAASGDGVTFVDATIDGELDVLPEAEIPGLRRDG